MYETPLDAGAFPGAGVGAALWLHPHRFCGNPGNPCRNGTALHRGGNRHGAKSSRYRGTTPPTELEETEPPGETTAPPQTEEPPVTEAPTEVTEPPVTEAPTEVTEPPVTEAPTEVTEPPEQETPPTTEQDFELDIGDVLVPTTVGNSQIVPMTLPGGTDLIDIRIVRTTTRPFPMEFLSTSIRITALSVGKVYSILLYHLPSDRWAGWILYAPHAFGWRQL